MTTNVVCLCGEIIMKSENGTEKIRSKIVVVRNGSVSAVCKGCGVEVDVPLMRSVTPQAGPPIILRK